jgi:hypothetical protein
MNQEMIITLNYNIEFSAYWFDANSAFLKGSYATPNAFDLDYATVWVRQPTCLLNVEHPIDPSVVIIPSGTTTGTVKITDIYPGKLGIDCIDNLKGKPVTTAYDSDPRGSPAGIVCNDGYFHDDTSPYTGLSNACLGVFGGDGDHSTLTCDTNLNSLNNLTPCLGNLLNSAKNRDDDKKYFCDSGCWYLACTSANGAISADCGGFKFQAYNTDIDEGNGQYIFNKLVNEKLVLTMSNSAGYAAYYFQIGSGLQHGGYRTFQLDVPITSASVWRRNDAVCDGPQPSP